MQKMEEKPNMNYFNPKYFIFELPLYSKITTEYVEQLDDLLTKQYSIDYYNPILKDNTTYRVYIDDNFSADSFSEEYPLHANFLDNRYCVFESNKMNSVRKEIQNKRIGKILKQGGFFTFFAVCSRTNTVHTFNYQCDVKDHKTYGEWIIQKIGQYPSRADFELGKIKQYQKILDSEYKKEYTRAIGLNASGIGIGSFVYLRRIFESLIDDALNQAKNNVADWNDSEYQSKKMVDKIKILKSYIPDFLYENASIYSILSKGIHELSEEECLDYFDVLRLGIDIILEERLEKINKDKLQEEAKKKIQKINKTLK